MAIRITSSGVSTVASRSASRTVPPAAPPIRICQPPSTATMPMSLTVASAQLRGQPETPDFTLAGVWRPSHSFSSAMPSAIESPSPKRQKSSPTQVFTVRTAFA